MSVQRKLLVPLLVLLGAVLLSRIIDQERKEDDGGGLWLGSRCPKPQELQDPKIARSFEISKLEGQW